MQNGWMLMKFVVIEGANVTLAEAQDEYETIAVRRTTVTVKDGNGNTGRAPCMTLELKPDAEDLHRLSRGGSIFVSILGNMWPPCSVTTTDPMKKDGETLTPIQ